MTFIFDALDLIRLIPVAIVLGLVMYWVTR